MRMAYELCLATAGKQVPSGPDWIHEVKHDGYRMLVIRENDRVSCYHAIAAIGRSAIPGSPKPR
jgi:bifunctional non-homologous end joining protein LigD